MLKNNIEGIILKWSYQVFIDIGLFGQIYKENINNIKNKDKHKTWKIFIADRGGVE